MAAAETLLKRSPAGLKVPAAAAAVAGALFAAVWAPEVPPWYFMIPAVAAAPLLLGRRGALLAAGCFLLTWGSGQLRQAFAPRPGWGARPFAARAVLLLDDARVSGAPGLGEAPRMLRVRVLSYRDPATGETRPGRDAEAALVPPPGSGSLRCGAVVEASGTLTPLPERPGPGDDSFVKYLRRRNFTAVIRAAELRECGRRRGVRAALADLRDAMLTRLFDGVRRPVVRKLAAALFCGAASGVPDGVRRDFGAAGIIHIFSVSGMHVAVLALCFAWLLRALPFNVRCPALTLLVWCYVLVTGAGTPAVRAGTMISLWALLRVMLLHLRGADVLCWTAVLMLAADPGTVHLPGAQYSFLITGALLLLAERRDRRRFPEGSVPWPAPRRFAARGELAARRFARSAREVLAGATTAFLAGAAVSLRMYAHRLGTGAVAANILLALFMPGLYVLLLVQLAAGVCGVGARTAPLFEWAFLKLVDFAAFFGEHFPDAGAVPPHWSVAVLYSFALLAALGGRRVAVRRTAWLVVAGIGIWQLARPFGMAPAVLVHAPEDGRPPLVLVADPARKLAAAVNAPDPGTARRAAEFLRERGIREVELLSFSSRGGASASGIAALAREIGVRRIRFDDAAAAGRCAGVRCESAQLHRDLCRIVPLKRGFRLDYSDPGSKLYIGVAVTEGDAGYEVVAERSGKRAAKLLPWSIDREEWIYEFDE